MAVGNTFGATALSSYGGFWLSYAIILTPGGFDIGAGYTDPADLQYAIGFYLLGWWIFTSILLYCTLRSTVAFFSLFFTLDIAFLLLGIAQFYLVDGAPNAKIAKAGGFFAILSAFLAWYNALAGLAEPDNT
jgi:succinate-acetate transporter protein